MVNPIQIQSVKGPAQPPPLRAAQEPQGTGFASVLDQAQDATRPIRFSAHAQQRLRDRNIQLTQSDHHRIATAMDAAAKKGAREAVLVMDQLALVVSVPNRTVITVVEPETGEDSVFTNIDSVVLMTGGESVSSPEPTLFGLDPAWGGPHVANR